MDTLLEPRNYFFSRLFFYTFPSPSDLGDGPDYPTLISFNKTDTT